MSVKNTIEKIKIGDIDYSLDAEYLNGQTGNYYQAANITQTIDEKSTESQYPSAKAVYNAIQSISVSTVTSISSSATDAEIPSAKAVYDAIASKTDAATTAINALNTDKADKATTLSGYGITDAKISDGVITLGSNTITPLTSQDITGKADVATTLSGYGITDAYISDGAITLGSNTITPLTSHQDISSKQDKSNLVTALSSTNTDTQYPSAKAVYDVITDNEETLTAAINTLNTTKADVATTLSGYGITDAYISDGAITLGSNTITPLTSHQDISSKQDKSNLVTALSSTNTDTQYPSAKCVYDAIATKISSESIATIWKGTQSEYDDLGTYSSTTLYIIA